MMLLSLSPAHKIDSMRHTPLERLHGQSQRKERDAHKQRDDEARLLRMLADQQHPAAEHQLAAHFERLPPEAVARLSEVEVPVRSASRLDPSSPAYSRGMPTGHTASIAKAMAWVFWYSSESHESARSAYR
eukprot:7162496-Prymnesium_polylepis.4